MNELLRENLNEIIKWTGWAAAIGIVIYELIKWWRYRRIIKIETDIIQASPGNSGTKYLNVTVKNIGRCPSNIIAIGFQFSNGEIESFDQPYFLSPQNSIESGGISPKAEVTYPTFWIYKKRPRVVNISYSVLREIQKKHNSLIAKIYVVEETGDEHQINIPDNIKRELRS